jgi:hypothetical protein
MRGGKFWYSTSVYFSEACVDSVAACMTHEGQATRSTPVLEVRT